MRFLHLSDLHIGRRLNEYSLIDDQRIVLEQASTVLEEQDCDAVIIAGDVYDKSSPAAEAMRLFDSFVSRIIQSGKKIYMISGNHDSMTRITYFSDIIQQSGVYTSGEFTGRLRSFDIQDNITIHLMPFLKPSMVRPFYEDRDIRTYEDGVRAVIENSPVDKSRINIIAAHQFITGGETCESEEFAVGGTDNISASVFDDFDYVALGHLHRAQKCSRETVRYAGSPLKYSISEENHKKTFTVIDVKGKGGIEIIEIPVDLPHDVRTVKGRYDELMDMTTSEDYVRVVVTDETVIPDARILLRSVFPNMLRFCIENSKTSYERDVLAEELTRDMEPLQLFCEFYAFQNNGVMPDERQMEVVKGVFAGLDG